MALFSVGGSIPKVQIDSFRKMDFKDKDKGDVGTITLPLVTSDNGIVQKYALDWGGDNPTAAGESARVMTFSGYKTEWEDLTINTIIDATGVYRVDSKEGPGLEKISFDPPNIEEYLTELRKVVYAYDPEMHQAPYIKITWGKIFAASGSDSGSIAGVFKGVLSSMEINYDLFSTDGKPVRAKVSMIFKPFVDPKIRPAGNSPDLTHIIEVKPGDNLAKLCNEVYESPDYYHQVAQANGLASAYALRPGMKLVFPPLDKLTR